MSSEVTFRPATAADAEPCARIVYDAFCGIADRHNFPHDFPSIEATLGLCRMFTTAPKIHGIVAQNGDGRIIGSNFLDERDPIRGVGPITIDPAFQGRGVGRKLMDAIIERGRGGHGGAAGAGIRLVQDAFNTVSMALYASLGFEVKEPLALMIGKPATKPSGLGEARPLTDADLPACSELCRNIHGFQRAGELADALRMFGPIGLFRSGRPVAYLSAPTFWPLNHGVAEAQDDLTELLAAAGAMRSEPLTLLAPIRRTGLFRWCLAAGLRVIKPMTLMAMGAYHEPAGGFYPSVAY